VAKSIGDALQAGVLPSARPAVSRRQLGLVLAAAVFALPLLPVPEFWITKLNYIGLYALVALGLVLLTGVGGLTSFGQSAFAGMAAYATAYLTTQHGGSPWVGLALGVGLAILAALLLGALTLRMSGHYLPLATIAWCLALYYLMGNLEVLGKYDGLLAVPPIELLGVSFKEGRRMYYLIWITALSAAVGLVLLLDSRPGRAMRALNGSTVLTEAVGASAYRYKLQMFVLAAVLAALSGWLFAHLQRTVNPSPFGIKFGIEYLFMAVLGGVGSVGGAFTGALLVKLAEDQLQVWLPKLLGAGGNVEIIVFGAALILLLNVAPRGLWPLLDRWLPARRRHEIPTSMAKLPVRTQPVAGSVVLQVRGLGKNFGGLAAVSGVDFDLRAREILGLIGPNGAGKSTTFHLLSGVLAPSAGEVRFLGRPATALPTRELAHRGMARTFQHVKLVPEMTVLENVALGAYQRTRTGVAAALLRLDRRDEGRVLTEAMTQLQRIGMAQLAHEHAGNLPLGSQRLMEVARALAADPAVLLLDEPAAGLRHQEKQALGAVLLRLKAEGLSMLLVEHDMEFLMRLADRVVVMESGRKLFEGTPAEVQQSAAVRAAYLGVEDEA
jgi:branched-chain amino acid transport system permease protein